MLSDDRHISRRTLPPIPKNPKKISIKKGAKQIFRLDLGDLEEEKKWDRQGNILL